MDPELEEVYTNASKINMKDGNLFPAKYIKEIVKKKFIVFIGDSVVRTYYKDLVCVLENVDHPTDENRLLMNDMTEMKAKAEDSFLGDRLTFRTEKSTGTEFFEAREYQSRDGFHVIQYYFVTRCYNDRIEQILEQWNDEADTPDLVFMSSCLWDISRYEDEGEQDFPMYQSRMSKLAARVREELPLTSTFIWITTLPVASKIAADAFLTAEVQSLQEVLRIGVLIANRFATQIMASNGFEVIDLHFYTRAMMKHREPDGVHWDSFAQRNFTDQIITWLLDSWGITMPREILEKLDREKNTDLGHLKLKDSPSFAKPMVQFLGDIAKRYREFFENGNEIDEDLIFDQLDVSDYDYVEVEEEEEEEEGEGEDMEGIEEELEIQDHQSPICDASPSNSEPPEINL